MHLGAVAGLDVRHPAELIEEALDGERVVGAAYADVASSLRSIEEQLRDLAYDAAPGRGERRRRRRGRGEARPQGPPRVERAIQALDAHATSDGPTDHEHASTRARASRRRSSGAGGSAAVEAVDQLADAGPVAPVEPERESLEVDVVVVGDLGRGRLDPLDLALAPRCRRTRG